MIDVVVIGDSSSSSSEDDDVTIISVTNEVIEVPSSGDEQTNDNMGKEISLSGSSHTSGTP